MGSLQLHRITQVNLTGDAERQLDLGDSVCATDCENRQILRMLLEARTAITLWGGGTVTGKGQGLGSGASGSPKSSAS